MGRALMGTSDVFKMTEDYHRFVLWEKGEQSKMLKECTRKKEKRDHEEV